MFGGFPLAFKLPVSGGGHSFCPVPNNPRWGQESWSNTQRLYVCVIFASCSTIMPAIRCLGEMTRSPLHTFPTRFQTPVKNGATHLRDALSGTCCAVNISFWTACNPPSFWRSCLRHTKQRIWGLTAARARVTAKLTQLDKLPCDSRDSARTIPVSPQSPSLQAPLPSAPPPCFTANGRGASRLREAAASAPSFELGHP